MHEVSSYEAALSDACKGVIRHIDISDNHKTIESNIMNYRNLLALEEKTIKNSRSVIIVFDGLRVPHCVRYEPTLVPCYLYRRHMWENIGHRGDVCADPAPPSAESAEFLTQHHLLCAIRKASCVVAWA